MIADYTSTWKYMGPPGASPETLERRIKYGGRKGRRAVKRLSRPQAYVSSIVFRIPVAAEPESPAQHSEEGDAKR